MRQPLTGGEHNDDTSVSRGPQQPPLAAKGHTLTGFSRVGKRFEK